jgi:hypothetical protein
MPTFWRLVSAAILIVTTLLIRTIFPLNLIRGQTRDKWSGGGGAVDHPKSTTYNNPRFRVALSYPKGYLITESETDFGVVWRLIGQYNGTRVQKNLVMLATVDIPQSLYPGSSLARAFVNVSVNKDLDEIGCQRLLDEPDRPSTLSSINGTTFWTVSFGGMEDHGFSYHETNYVGFKNSTCYEITVGYETTYPVVEDLGSKSPAPVDTKALEQRLEHIVETIRIY